MNNFWMAIFTAAVIFCSVILLVEMVWRMGYSFLNLLM